MLDYLSDVFTVIYLYVNMLFKLELLPGVSIGSVLLLALLFYAIIKNLWFRSDQS